MTDDRLNLTQEEVSFSSGDDLPSNSDKIEILIKALSDQILQIKPGKNKSVFLFANEDNTIVRQNLESYESWLEIAHNYFRDATKQDLSLTYASEWILDNYFVIRQAIRQIKEDLPSGYYNQLPIVSNKYNEGFPLIYAIARAVLASHNYLFDPIYLQEKLTYIQEKIKLSTGELWAAPIFLRYCLIEFLAHILVPIISPKELPNLPFLKYLITGENPSGSSQNSNSDTVANIIISLRAISEQNWNDFFESVSHLELTLRKDPSGIYPQMDFKTRDLYRQKIEKLAKLSGRSEIELAELTIKLANQTNSGQPIAEAINSNDIKTSQRNGSPQSNEILFEDSDKSVNTIHVGEFLIGNRRSELEKQIGYKPNFLSRIKRWSSQNASSLYMACIQISTLAIFLLLLRYMNLPTLLASAPFIEWLFIILLAGILLIPINVVVTSLVNWLVTLTVPPRTLPKMDFKEEIPPEFETLVVIPALITNSEEIDSLIRQLELHYLRNPEPGLSFALLTDYRDADSETHPEDENLIKSATEAIKSLNKKYQRTNSSQIKSNVEENESEQKNQELFFLFHRKRLWNASEGKWIGWERKRGKLHELNLLLRGSKDLTFSNLERDKNGNFTIFPTLQNIKFVITLDTDTILPRSAACRLVSTLAHPLNQARFNEKTNRVISGYTILQPRMEIHPRSANLSVFTQIFAGDSGLDLYTLAVSDAYQDLFGEGSYVGKGIYDVDAFQRSIEGRIPENTVLSHDLLEGSMGRAGLVTDITMIEDYPPNYLVNTLRQRRWIRGDWQLIPWLLKSNPTQAVFSKIDRWKILDNLIRSLLSPGLFTIFVIGLVFLPQFSALWSIIPLISLGIPILTGLAHSTIQTVGGTPLKIGLRTLKMNLYRWILAVAFLPYEAYISFDAVLTTLYRVMISHRNLLQWTTAAQTAKRFDLKVRRTGTWQKLSPAPFLVLILILISQSNSGFVNQKLSPAIIESSFVLLLWTLSPFILWLINRPIVEKIVPLNDEQTNRLRQVARRTWNFFEQFVGPEDHWLPPDHYQEAPVGKIAHRTSPTNIGLLFTSTLAAYDLGYLDQVELVTRLMTTMDTLDQLEQYRGHFLNWYDTISLQPLRPRYISTVDSGNLAASLIVTAQACKKIPDEPIFCWELWQGYLDSLSNLSETLVGLKKAEFADRAEDTTRQITQIQTDILAARKNTALWYELYLRISGPFWQDLSSRFMELVKVGNSAFDLETLRKLQKAAAQVERHHSAVRRIIAEFVPWIPLISKPPALLLDIRYDADFNDIRKKLPFNTSLSQIRKHGDAALPCIRKLKKNLRSSQFDLQADLDAKQTTLEWLDALENAITLNAPNAGAVLNGFENIAKQAEKYVENTDFKFLYHPFRRVFHIGFNLDNGQFDNNFYDLLASEARITSILAIAMDEVPPSHWMQLGRPATISGGHHVLLSWSATMFEYLMPPLFLRSYPGTLLAESIKGSIFQQISYAKTKNIPWGFSESGYYRFDNNFNFQYKAFGVPGLGFKRGLGDDQVVTPYASIMAINYNPSLVVQNLERLIEYNCFGMFGFYESIDFTTERLLPDVNHAVVTEYMAHHQGMIMMALVNYFKKDIMVKRMHSDPRIQSAELFLQEQIPPDLAIQNPYTEDVKGIQRISNIPDAISSWQVPIPTPTPQVHLLSNGSFNVIISNSGSGYSFWKEFDLTRWQPDSVLDSWGSWIYIQDLSPTDRKNWSAGYQPIPGDPGKMRVTFFPHMAVFRRSENGITSTMEVTVSPEDPIEIRRIHLHNTTAELHKIKLSSYAEVILSPQAVDARHPAFNKMFIESEIVPELNLQIFKRRMRSPQDQPVYLGHRMIISKEPKSVQHETDRGRFVGRNQTIRKPAALESDQPLSGTSGATLDPIFAIAVEIDIKPNESLYVNYLTFASDSREEILRLAEKYQSRTILKRSFIQSNLTAHTWLGKQGMTTRSLIDSLKTLSALLYASKEMRSAPEIIASNRLNQSALWRFGISGDFPIMLVEIGDPKQIDLVKDVLQIHKFLAIRQFKVDLVILNTQQTDYGAELNGILYRLLTKVDSNQFLNQRGGIFLLNHDQLLLEERVLLKTAAYVVFKGENGELSSQIPGYLIQVHHLPDHIPTRQPSPLSTVEEDLILPLIKDLQFYNGYGGFSPTGHEYIIEVNPEKSTPAPWVNVIGYPEFGFMVSESGSQCTWSMNSGENRITPWSNDPVSDPSGEALYLRDEETGEIWSPTPYPAGVKQTYRVTHGAGYSTFEHHSHGLRQKLTLFASPEDPVKIIHLKVENTYPFSRRITATQYVEWVLGLNHAASRAFIIPEYDVAGECLLATNPYNAEFGSRAAFLIASKPIHGLTSDRAEFLGRNGTVSFPAALKRLGLETRITPGEDPCGVLQIHLDLLPGQIEEIYFVLGEGIDRDHALNLAKKYHDPAYVGAANQRTQVFWEKLLGTIQVHTPEPSMDLILNRWMLYQALSCRIWGRTGFYQSSGAFGFRDQLQDVLALLPIDPTITRGQLLIAAGQQFEAGDVMHWWHPPSGRGIRTRYSDDLLWLPYVTSLYIETTGDIKILDEEVPFQSSPPLEENESERYGASQITSQSYSLLEHCLRAIEKGATSGKHGLPLMGSGDWNDGMNRVGESGRGESIWLAWFLCDVLDKFANVCDQTGDTRNAIRFRTKAIEYAKSIEQFGWDGDWYQRAYFDDGSILGTVNDSECRIDAIAQSWAVISRAGDIKRSLQAMKSVLDLLVRPVDGLSLLLTSPFDKTDRDPGYIKGYPPGIRENGGQYSHAAIWTAWAFAMLGDGDQAGKLFNFLNPILHSDDQPKAELYRVEPFVISADIYSTSPFIGHGGWTWYTGSAAWMHRLGMEAILGIHKMGMTLKIDPVIPPAWEGFEIRYQYNQSTYHIQVKNPDHIARGIKQIKLNSKILRDLIIPLLDDGKIHQVEVMMG